MFKRDLIKGFLSLLFLPAFQTSKSDVAMPIAEDLQNKYDQLFGSLAVRDDNDHYYNVGGNNFQFLVLMQMNHYHSNVKTIGFHEDKMYINEEWLRESSIEIIRKELDCVFETASDEFKLIAKDYVSIPFALFMSKHQVYFPILKDGSNIIKTIVYEDLSKLTKFEQLLISCYFASIIASDLDNNDLTNLDYFFKVIETFDPSITIYSIRVVIGIERVIKHDLDKSYLNSFVRIKHVFV